MKNLFVVIVLMFVAVSFTGCATSIPSSPSSSIDLPGGEVVTLPDGTKAYARNKLIATGDLNGVAKKKTVVTETDAAGNVLKVITTEVEEQVARNAYDAEHELEMRREQRKEVVGSAANSYRPASNWYGGGGVVITGSGGRNYVHNSGGGTSTGGNTGATITTGNGGVNSVSSHPSGSNTSGGNSGGTTITTGSGGTNTTYRH